MKKLLVGGLLTGVLNVMYATEPMFSPDTEWNYVIKDMADIPIAKRTYGIRDSIVNGVTYQFTHNKFIRTEGAKVWCLVDSMGKQIEQLIYDFDMQVGDSIPVVFSRYYEGEDYPAGYSKVTHVESITLPDGRSARRLSYEGRPDDIEHIGSTLGLVNSMINEVEINGTAEEFACCTRGDNLLFETALNECDKLKGMEFNTPVAPYFAEGTTWTTFHYPDDDCDGFKDVCVMQGDTLIDGKTYHKIVRTHYIVHRFDIIDNNDVQVVPILQEGRKIFARYGGEDILLCDFGMEVGDVFPQYEIEDGKAFYTGNMDEVLAVDSVTLADGRRAKRLSYDMALPDIEYVGCVYGVLSRIFMPAITLCGGGTIACCSLDGEQIYGQCQSIAEYGAGSETTRLHYANTWHCITYQNMFGDVLTEDVTYKLTSQINLTAYTYRKLVDNNNNWIGALRQSEDSMKVYYCDATSGFQEEYMLYDFSANVGDTIKDAYFRLEDMRVYTDFMGEPESVGWLVTEKHRTDDGRIVMTVARCYDDGVTQPRYHTQWIQGIGTPNGLWPTLYGTGSYNTLYTLCAAYGDETLYTYNLDHIGIVNNCTEWHFKQTAINDAYMSDLSLVQKGNILHIRTTDELSEVQIYILNGQCVLQSAGTDIDVSALPQGMYLLRARTSDDRQHQAKFIRE